MSLRIYDALLLMKAELRVSGDEGLERVNNDSFCAWEEMFRRHYGKELKVTAAQGVVQRNSKVLRNIRLSINWLVKMQKRNRVE